MGSASLRRAVLAGVYLSALATAGCGFVLGIDNGKPEIDAGEFDTGVEFPDGSGDSGAAIQDSGHESTTDVATASGDAGCVPGSVQCSGQTPQFCNSGGQWQNLGQTCSAPTPVCHGGQCVQCTPGSLGCNGQQPQECGPTGTWQTVGSPCANQACSNGACTGVCAPGATQCTSATAEETCGANGMWGSAMSCQFVCQSNACAGACTPNSTRCDGTGVDTCGSNGQWGATQSCPTNMCTAGACSGSCTDGMTECSGNGLQTCSGGTWGTPVACVASACVGTSCTGSCVPGTTECDGNTDYRLCDSSGAYGNPIACQYVCVGTSCGGVCTPGATTCSGNSVLQCGSTGEWGSAMNCTGMACVSGSCTGVCTPGTMMCTSDTQIKTCDMTGNWGSPITCPGEACVNNECTGNCSPGAMQCLGDQPQLCESDGGWGDNGPTCSGGCTSGCGGTDATLDTGFMCGGNGCGQNSDCCPMAPYCPNSGTGTGNCTTLMCQGDGGVCETTSDCCAPLSCAGAELAGGFDSGVPTPGACQ